MKDKRYSEEDVKDWEQLPMISSVITSGYFGAWLYYRDKRRDKRVNAELLDKVLESITEIYKCYLYCTEDYCDKEQCQNAEDCFYGAIIKAIERMKAEVDE